MVEKKRIGIFGGSFDPPHLGHLTIAGAARDGFALDEVRFTPCFVSPHKMDRPPTSAALRVEMLRAATANLAWAVVDEREIARGGPSYSWETAESLHAEFPGALLFWIMGADQWAALPRWSRPERLAELVEFLVFPRNGESPVPRAGFKMRRLDATHPASATEIRLHPQGNPWLPPGVERIIRREGLYG